VALVLLKNIAQPVLVWGGLLLLGYQNPLLGEAVVTTALPILVAVAMLAVQYQVAEGEPEPNRSASHRRRSSCPRRWPSDIP